MAFIINNKTISNDSNKSLFELAIESNIVIPSSCKKQGKCKECLIEIEEGQEFLSDKLANEKHLDSRFRLSCQTFIEKEGDIVAQLLKRPILKIEDSGVSLLEGFDIDPMVTREDGNVMLEGIIIKEHHEGELLGLVIDIGTTTIVMRIFDLESGQLKASSTFENPQRFAGSNVMARIAYDTEYGKKELKRVLTAYISNTLLSMIDNPEDIFEVVVGGNTTMRDLFFGIDVYSIGQSPYYSLSEIDVKEGNISSTSIKSTGKKMHLPIDPRANVYGLPIIGGHVGADTSACLLSIGIMESDANIVMMDIGTNTEIVIGNKTKVLAASSPSGPAFEGGGINHGMPALNGAIEKVKIDKGHVSIKTVGNEKPIGICGSGLIDTIGELRRNEMINEMGRFEEDEEEIFLSEDKKIFLSEYDINLLAQTKGANAAALSILYKQYGIDFSDVKYFYLAGGFGKHIDIKAGIRIGMLPNIPLDKFVKIGNATIEGLSMVLLSKTKRAELDNFVKNIEQVNLESDPDFFDYFVDGCLFESMNNV